MHVGIYTYIYICMHIAQIYVGCGWLGGWGCVECVRLFSGLSFLAGTFTCRDLTGTFHCMYWSILCAFSIFYLFYLIYVSNLIYLIYLIYISSLSIHLIYVIYLHLHPPPSTLGWVGGRLGAMGWVRPWPQWGHHGNHIYICISYISNMYTCARHEHGHLYMIYITIYMHMYAYHIITSVCHIYICIQSRSCVCVYEHEQANEREHP